MQTYKELIVWQKSFALAKEIYRLTGLFPKAELYGLVSQMRRAAVSVVSNIAEGFVRRSIRENHQFISISLGSLGELETQLLLAKELKLAEQEEFAVSGGLLVEVRKMLIKLRQSLDR